VPRNRTIANSTLFWISVLTGATFINGCSSSGWHNWEIELPGQSGLLRLSARHAHLFLPEYDYRAVVLRTRRPQLNILLEPQSGGPADLEITWYPDHDGHGPFIRFQHKDPNKRIEELVDLSTGDQWSLDTDADSFNRALGTAADLPAISLGRVDDSLQFVNPGNKDQ
jgi:hypothetical protein